MKDYWDNESKNNLSRNRKIAAGTLVLFGVFVLGLWFVDLKATIKSSLVTKSGTNYTNVASSTCTGPDCPENIAKLKTQDTDKDGLTDYDEIYVYNTSAYLEDSDSDGYTDYEEVSTGKDPNCPAGQVCQTASTETSIENSTTTTNTSSASSNIKTSSQSGIGSSDITEENLQNIFSGQIDAATLRQMLLSSGMAADQLSKFSDEELMRTYNETLNSQNN